MRPSSTLLPAFVPQETTPAIQSVSPGMSWGNTFAVWLFSLIILAGGGYLIWDWMKTLENNLATQNEEESRRPRSTPSGALSRGVDAVQPGAIEAAKQRAIDRHIDFLTASTEFQSAVEGLFNSKTLEERLTFIDGGVEYRDAVEKLFSDPDSAKLLAYKRFPLAPLWLPGKEAFPLFQIITKANRAGAMTRLNKGADGRYRLHWPMFEESHSNRLQLFVDTPTKDAQWFYAGLHRSHGLELSKQLREEYHAFDLQGSPTGSGRVYAYAAKNSPAGRYLSNQMDWGGVYLTRVLVRWSDIAPDRQGILILACEGEEGEVSMQKPTQAVEPAEEVRIPEAAPPIPANADE